MDSVDKRSLVPGHHSQHVLNINSVTIMLRSLSACVHENMLQPGAKENKAAIENAKQKQRLKAFIASERSSYSLPSKISFPSQVHRGVLGNI